MLAKNLEKALNDQINAEFYSAYLYLSMSAYAEKEGWAGIANWMKIQAKEEATHANKLFDYVNERGAVVTLSAIDAVPTEFGTVIELFEKVLEHEQLVTSKINNLVDLAIEGSDHALRSMLMWFVDEQVEEEANVTQVIDDLKMVDGKGQGLLIIDREMKSRTFVDETLNA